MSSGRFDGENAAALGRKGGHARAAKLRAARGEVEPYAGTFQDFMTEAGLVGPSWATWRVFWKAVDALPLDEAELAVFRRHTGRTSPPAAPVREAWDLVGRRGGKTRSKAARALWTGIRRNWREVLAPGERAVIPLIAADRKQARQALGYIKGLLQLPAFAPFARRALKETVELATNATLEVHTASFKTTRGYTCPLVLGDEVAFWASEDGSASPDAEVLQALRPTMSTIADALLAAGSTPYAKRGAVWSTFERHYGRDDTDVLVWRGASRDMNPTLSEAVVRGAYEDDPVAAAAEYGGEFRADVSAFLSREAVQACVVSGRRELPRVTGITYHAFVDPSGGSQDSMTLAVAHAEHGRAMLDCVREVAPPFSPESVVGEFAGVLKSYGLSEVTGDRYAGEWPRERFKAHGIKYQAAELSKSELYVETLPLINAGRCELLDHPKLAAQFCGLERRTGRGTGRDSVDHPPGGRDDLVNATCGALVLVSAAQARPPFIFRALGDGEPSVRDEGPSPIDRAVQQRGFWFPGDPLPIPAPEEEP